MKPCPELPGGMSDVWKPKDALGREDAREKRQREKERAAKEPH
jgi:hypothetical protein